MVKDVWHFPRTALAEQVVGMFNTGLSSALIFFAPRRMGKTEFLCKDIQPFAKKHGWETFYFSFLDTSENVQDTFTRALVNFSEQIGPTENKGKLLSRIRKISGGAVGIRAELELRDPKHMQYSMQDIISCLATQGNILLLMDEVQVLTRHEENELFIAGLRTALDLHKDNVKVIFTGSSREGLRRMFSQASAPFFHFGQNLPFPELGQDFTDHLADVLKKVSKRSLDKKILWQTFEEMQKVPQLARSLVERLVLNPKQTITEAKEQLLADVFNDRAFVEIWENSSKLEQLLLQEIAKGTEALFSEKTRNMLAKQLGVDVLAVPSVQSALRVLQRKILVGKHPERSSYFIDDPNFKSWLEEH